MGFEFECSKTRVTAFVLLCFDLRRTPRPSLLPKKVATIRRQARVMPPSSSSLAFLTSLPLFFVPPSAAVHTRPRCARMGADDLLIVGAGTLGARIGLQWRHHHPDATIIGETRTDRTHADLLRANIQPALAGELKTSCANVVFCTPPSAVQEYAIAVDSAAKRATRRFVFTSSASVYAREEVVTETTKRASGERANVLREAEDAALRVGNGVVLRLAGLYLLKRGPHTFWMRRGEVTQSESKMINLVHYDDAAAAVVCALGIEQLPKQREFLIAARSAVTPREIVECALAHPQFAGEKSPRFVNAQVEAKRSLRGEWSRETLGWLPKYDSFKDFMKIDAERVVA